MAKKISQLTQATEVKSDDVTVIVQDGETKKLPLNMMVTKQDIENKKIAGLAKLDEIEATYENDTYTPTITVKNKSSVKVGEGDGVDYSANVMDGHVKSAILKGQTLMNDIDLTNRLLTSGNTITSDGYITINANSGYSNAFVGYKKIKPNTKYLCVVDINEYTANGEFSLTSANPQSVFNVVTTLNSGEIGVKKFILTSRDTIDESVAKYSFRSYLNSNSTNGYVKYRVMMIEYQEGMENWDIPYFEGMQSVKMPVLTTTGKNLFNYQGEELNCYFSAELMSYVVNYSVNTYCVEVLPNTTYTLSYKRPTAQGLSHITYWDENKVCIGAETNRTDHLIRTVTTPSNCRYIKFPISKTEVLDIQVEQGSTTTSYEPYKTNILTANEPVELRGIGDVQDELNCLTGVVTERIGEINTASMNESYFIGYALEPSGLYRMTINVENLNINGLIKCNKLPVVPFMNSWDLPYECITIYNGGILLYLKDAPTVESFVNKAIGLDLIIQYVKVQNSVKTVDLMPSGTHPSTTPYCWKNGHIQLSSSGLLPNLEYSVVTSRAGQINQNATMIVKNDKRIFDLEILLAGGLVNTTYQALTLQNQVETGLSKVSLNSETEPDYLLYHMIMKLIEEKAYKLDDLTEKVSVFYLYEKLSDEQFETIYSALYPFVEDEIVEEPVVEELPEVVEDEVIM